jgi:hypothetical protein
MVMAASSRITNGDINVTVFGYCTLTLVKVRWRMESDDVDTDHV